MPFNSAIINEKSYFSLQILLQLASLEINIRLKDILSLLRSNVTIQCNT